MSIKITEAYQKEARNKLDAALQVEEKLAGIELQKYSKKLDELVVVFQCFPPDIKSRKVKEYKVMRRKTPTLELYLILDYDKVMQGTDAENLNYMKEVLLKGCEKFLKPLKEFDWPAFEAALHEHLF